VKLTRLSQLAMVMLCSVAAYCQVDSSGRTAQYSNMYVVEDEGDSVGWDVQVKTSRNGYSVILFCGEGEVEGPVRAQAQFLDGTATIHPENKICGDVLVLKLDRRGINIKSGNNSSEFVPRRKNFLKQELFK
jgi:hypothetical protein